MTLSSRCPENRYLSPNWCQLMAAFQESTVYISLEPKDGKYSARAVMCKGRSNNGPARRV